jgi:hypothetical protein
MPIDTAMDDANLADAQDKICSEQVLRGVRKPDDFATITDFG